MTRELGLKIALGVMVLVALRPKGQREVREEREEREVNATRVVAQ
jgi:hypothetical protein